MIPRDVLAGSAGIAFGLLAFTSSSGDSRSNIVRCDGRFYFKERTPFLHILTISVSLIFSLSYVVAASRSDNDGIKYVRGDDKSTVKEFFPPIEPYR